MAARKTSPGDVLGPLAEERRRVLGERPSVDELAAYREGRLPPAAFERVQDFIAHCPITARSELDRLRLGAQGAVGEAPRLSEHELAAERRKLRARIAAAEAAEAGLVPGLEDRAAVPPRARWVSAAAAALAGIALVLATGWYSSWRTVEELTAVQTSLPIVDLLPVSSLVRGRPTTGELRVPKTAEHFAVTLAAADRHSFDAYRLEIYPRGGSGRWRAIEGLQAEEEGHFMLKLHRSFLPEGTYRLQLLGLGPGGAEPLEEYHLQLTYR